MRISKIPVPLPPRVGDFVRARVARPSPGMAATAPRAAAMCRFLVSKRAQSLGLEPLPRLGVPREEGKVVVYVVYMS